MRARRERDEERVECGSRKVAAARKGSRVMRCERVFLGKELEERECC